MVSPFLSKSFGTERTVIEWLTHLPEVFEIHLYSQRVEDLEAHVSSGIEFRSFQVPIFSIFFGGSPQTTFAGLSIACEVSSTISSTVPVSIALMQT